MAKMTIEDLDLAHREVLGHGLQLARVPRAHAAVGARLLRLLSLGVGRGDSGG